MDKDPEWLPFNLADLSDSEDSEYGGVDELPRSLPSTPTKSGLRSQMQFQVRCFIGDANQTVCSLRFDRHHPARPRSSGLGEQALSRYVLTLHAPYALKSDHQRSPPPKVLLAS